MSKGSVLTPFIRGCLGNAYFAQFLCWIRHLILKIRAVFLRLNVSSASNLKKLSNSQTASQTWSISTGFACRKIISLFCIRKATQIQKKCSGLKKDCLMMYHRVYQKSKQLCKPLLYISIYNYVCCFGFKIRSFSTTRSKQDSENALFLY